MAEPTRFTTLEADAGGLPVFTTPSSIFDVPTSLLGGFPISADAGGGFLRGIEPTFNVPGTGGYTFSFGAPGSMAPSDLSLGELLNPWNIRSDITQLAPNWGTWNPATDTITAGDLGDFELTGTPFRNVGIDQNAIVGQVPTVTAGSNISTTAAGTGAVLMDPFQVSATNLPAANFNVGQLYGTTPTTAPNLSLLGGASTATPTGPTVLDPFQVVDTTLPKATLNLSDIYTPPPKTGPALLGGVTTEAPGAAVMMDPFQVVATNLPKATLNLAPVTTTPATTGTTTGMAGGEKEGVVQLPPVTVTGTREATTTTPTPSVPPATVQPPTGGGGGIVQLPPVTVTATRETTKTTPPVDLSGLLAEATKTWGNVPVQLPPFKVTPTETNITPPTFAPPAITPPTVTPPTITPPPPSVIVPPKVTVPPTTVTPPPPPTPIPPITTPVSPTITQTGTSTPTTTTTTGSAMNERDIAKELAKTVPALQQYQPAIQKMYGDLYQQFMPKGISETERGLIDQYTADLRRLQQRQAGMLAPEDVRQAQQSAREAYGARGQVMGPGAIGAEILNREAIRQQREDQARAALQSSYGNILNMANIQTGNLFSPIASLMSGTFNPLGAYPADVYGTNVNAQLAREIAQKNYEAAVRSAELAGAAQQRAGTTAAAGQIGGALIPSIIQGLGSIFCWVAREVYGEDNPKWMQFRDWMFRYAPVWFFNFYLENGERIAAWLKRNPWAKRPIRMWMDSRIRSMEKRELVLKEAI